MNINAMPNEMLEYIFDFLHKPLDRAKLSLVCKRWNDVAFNYRHLAQNPLSLDLTVASAKELPSFSRFYPILLLKCRRPFVLDEKDTKKILPRFKKLASALEELVCKSKISRGTLQLKILSLCTRLKKLELMSIKGVPDDELPVLEHLEVLKIEDNSSINITRLAPNLRKFRGTNDLHNLPNAIQKLPLENLQLSIPYNHVNVFENWTKPTMLTSINLYLRNDTDPVNLEQLCRCCPLLSKLKINVTKTMSLRCLTNLKHLKILGLMYYGHGLLEKCDFSLPSVEILELDRPMRFNDSSRGMFPNVYKLTIILEESITARISDFFPHLKILVMKHLLYIYKAPILDLLEGLTRLQILVLRDFQILNSDLPRMNVKQLSLVYSRIKMTDTMDKTFPNLQLINLSRESRCTYSKRKLKKLAKYVVKENVSYSREFLFEF